MLACAGIVAAGVAVDLDAAVYRKLGGAVRIEQLHARGPLPRRAYAGAVVVNPGRGIPEIVMCRNDRQDRQRPHVVRQGQTILRMVHDVLIHAIIGRITRLPGDRVARLYGRLPQDLAEEEVGVGVHITGHIVRQKCTGAQEGGSRDGNRVRVECAAGLGGSRAVGGPINQRIGREACDGHRERPPINATIPAELGVPHKPHTPGAIRRGRAGRSEIALRAVVITGCTRLKQLDRIQTDRCTRSTITTPLDPQLPGSRGSHRPAEGVLAVIGERQTHIPAVAGHNHIGDAAGGLRPIRIAGTGRRATRVHRPDFDGITPAGFQAREGQGQTRAIYRAGRIDVIIIKLVLGDLGTLHRDIPVPVIQSSGADCCDFCRDPAEGRRVAAQRHRAEADLCIRCTNLARVIIVDIQRKDRHSLRLQPIGNIHTLPGIGRGKGVSNGQSIRFDQRQIASASLELKIGMQLPPGHGAVFAGGEDEEESPGRQVRRGKGPKGQVGGAAGQMPPREIDSEW